MKQAALFVIPILLAGCDAHFKNPGNGSENVKMSGNANGQVAFNFPFASGQVKIPASMMQKGQFDIDGVRMIPGGSLTGFNVDAGDKSATVNIAFKSPVSPENTRAYFLDQFRQKGVQASAAGDAITGKSKDGNTFVIHVAAAGSGSNGTIQIQSNS